MSTDDPRIKQAYEYVKSLELKYSVVLEKHCKDYSHPNVAILHAKKGSRRVVVGGASVGGGLARIFRIYNKKVNVSIISAQHDLRKLCPYRTKLNS